MQIVFDFAGVVFHWQPLATLQLALPQHATDIAQAEHWAQQIFTGWGGDWGEFDRGRLDEAALVQRIAKRTGLGAAEVQAVVQAIPRALQPDAATVALIEALGTAGHRVLYLSNMPEPYAQWLETQYPLHQWFDDGVFSARVDSVKPEPAIYEKAARQFKTAPDNLLFLDDVVHNVRAAKACGWHALHYQSAAQAKAELAALGIC
jgi:putative hydrolase of the HAD superfamily